MSSRWGPKAQTTGETAAATTATGRQTGTVKSWGKGFGFIKRADGQKDIFVHQTSIKKSGFRSLMVGESVEFDIETKPDGRDQAVNVTGPGGADPKGQPRQPQGAGYGGGAPGYGPVRGGVPQGGYHQMPGQAPYGQQGYGYMPQPQGQGHPGQGQAQGYAAGQAAYQHPYAQAPPVPAAQYGAYGGYQPAAQNPQGAQARTAAAGQPYPASNINYSAAQPGQAAAAPTGGHAAQPQAAQGGYNPSAAGQAAAYGQKPAAAQAYGQPAAQAYGQPAAQASYGQPAAAAQASYAQPSTYGKAQQGATH